MSRTFAPAKQVQVTSKINEQKNIRNASSIRSSVTPAWARADVRVHTNSQAAQSAQQSLQRQPSPQTAQQFSVNQATYLQMVTQAIQQINFPLGTSETLSDTIQPILQAMLAQVTWRDDTPSDHGGGVIQHRLPGRPPLILNLQLVLSDEADPSLPAGRFAPSDANHGIILIFIRKNPTIDDLSSTLFHEALHLMSWVINRSGGRSRVSSVQQRAIRALDLSGHVTQISGIRHRLGLLATSINLRRRSVGQVEITNAELDNMARWVMDEIQVRAETEVFQQLLSVQRQRGHGPAIYLPTRENSEVNANMIDRYVFDFSRHFLPTDRAGLSASDQDILRELTQILEGFFQLQVRRRFSLTAYTTGAPPPQVRYVPPALEPPSFTGEIGGATSEEPF